MYHGTRQVAQQHYRDNYVPGIGTMPMISGVVEVTRHYYTCDHCGRAFAFPQAAIEPFYCHSAACGAVKLVSIDRE